MNPLVDRMAVVVARHSVITGLGYSRTRCGCGEMFTAPFVKSHAAHVAEQIAAELQLIEEVSVSVGQLSGCVMSPHDLESHHTVIARRWVSAWSAVEENP